MIGLHKSRRLSYYNILYMEETKTKGTWGGKREGAGRKPKPKPTRGGKREGAGRKKGTHIKENPLTSHLSFRCSADTLRRAQLLREQTKGDDVPFNRLFELWVESIAKDYGIE